MRMLRKDILKVTLLGLLTAGLTACSESPIETLSNGAFNGKSHIVLTFVTPNDGTSTRSATGDPDDYEAGIGYEDYINISDGDYKMYFFSYASGDTNGGTLIAEFKPTEITQASSGSVTTYTVTGDVPNELLSESDFRVVMLANYGGWYPTNLTPGTTTIDDLCEGDNTTFNAFKKFVIDKDNLIPFYGVQEYSSVSFATGETTTLTTPVSLLRAVAKVEVILTEDSEVEAFDAVSIVNYNSQGYNAPAGVYVAEDYDTNASKNPSTSDWPDEWVKELHLVGGSNDSGSKTQAFTQITSATQDTWRIYVPEYSNMDEDYSYITLTVGDEEYNIYFAEYTNGTTTAYGDEEPEGMPDRLNLKRNNLYRFYVTYEGGYFRVVVNKWEDTYENVFTYEGETVLTEDPDGGS